MRPAGMSSDEDFYDDEEIYFSINKPSAEEDRIAAEEAALPPRNKRVEIPENASDRKNAFHRAAEQADMELMTIMLQNGVSPDESNPKEWTPLMKACSRGDFEVVEFLLNNGADPNAQRDMFTPLMACCVCSYVQEEGRLKCVKKLVERGANVNSQDKFGATALMNASASGLDSIVSELLSVPTVDINLHDKEGWTALFFAVNSNYKAIALKLVNAGINLNAVNQREMTACQLANTKGFREIAELLKPSKKLYDARSAARSANESLTEFLRDLPDENGEGGFSKDVRDLFIGLGMKRVYEKCKINISIQDFLLMGEELETLGIHLEPVKWKLMTQGIHRYHIYPWKKSSLHCLDRESRFSFEETINCLANITKHFTLMSSTLKYLKMRIPKRIKGNNSVNKEVIMTLVNVYGEIDAADKNLKEIITIAKKIRSIGKQEVDLMEPKRTRPKQYHFYPLLAGSLAAFIYYKLR